MRDVYITAASRTPVGTLLGGLSTLKAHELGAIAIQSALNKSNVPTDAVQMAIMGQVLTAGQGQNPARQAAIKAGLPHATPAFGVNQLCGSGLMAIALGLQHISSGAADIIVAGGQESMSQAQHAGFLRAGQKLGEIALADTMQVDGLIDAFGGYHMGVTAENLARKYGIDRDVQDRFAFESHQKAALAQAQGLFKNEIVPVEVTKRSGIVIVEQDEGVRTDTSIEKLAHLKPAFEANGTVTAGNSSGINDGAAAIVLMSGEEVRRRDQPVMARIAGWATTGVDPSIMGEGPITATNAALQRAGWALSGVDLIESNEAFAAQSCAVGGVLQWDQARVNVNGGAIALGHPIGASGARILVTLVHEMERRNAKRALATLCIGGGMGIAMLVERD